MSRVRFIKKAAVKTIKLSKAEKEKLLLKYAQSLEKEKKFKKILKGKGPKTKAMIRRERRYDYSSMNSSARYLKKRKSRKHIP